MQIRKLAGLLLAACLALAAFAASSAMAEEAPTIWSGSSIKISSPSGVTVEKNGAEPKVCTTQTYGSATGSTSIEGIFGAYNRMDFTTKLSCPNSKALTLWFYYPSHAVYNTSTGKYLVDFNQGEILESPWGQYYVSSEAEIRGTFTNGSGATPSTLTVSHVPIGNLGGTTGPTLTLTGTFNVTSGSGGLLTLSH